VGTDFRIAVWLVQPRLNTVSNNGSTIRLEPKVMEVLVCLARHAGEPVSKEDLLQAVWPNTFVTDDVLKRSISELRRVFEDDVRESRIIQTIPKRGYRLLVAVEPVNGLQDATSAQAGRESRRTGRNWRTLAFLSGGVAAVLFILLGASYFFSRERLFGKSADPQIRSIAVLPLQNLSGDPGQEYFSDGMTDALITDLAQIGSLKVISRTSSMQYKQSKKSLPEIGRELSVDGIVEGSIQRSGDRVRITAQLIHGPSDRHLWANTYDGNFSDVFALERNVTQDIARQVQARLATRNQIASSEPRQTNPTALEAYLQGNYHLNRYGRGSGGEELKKASEYFQQAIDADPNFALAYIGLANTHGVGPVSSREDWELQRRAADKALTLDPNSSEAWTILVGFGGEDYAGTRAEQTEQGYRHALGLNPNSVEAREGLCTFLAEMGRLDEALRECQIAQELDPNNDHLGIILYERGEYDRAIQILRMMIERHPDDGLLHYVLFQVSVKKQNHPEAVQELEKALAAYGLSDAAAKIHHAFATSGYRAAMLQFAKEMENLQANKQTYLPVNLADVYAELGDNDRAFYWLEQAYVHRDMIAMGAGATFIGVDPMLVSLRSDPRFKDLVHRMGLPQ
jgi:TolB-like protein/DNA-binding winged helix-turn-helix (wHTH) protein/Tfp pilus assembly protein PilF